MVKSKWKWQFLHSLISKSSATPVKIKDKWIEKTHHRLWIQNVIMITVITNKYYWEHIFRNGNGRMRMTRSLYLRWYSIAYLTIQRWFDDDDDFDSDDKTLLQQKMIFPRRISLLSLATVEACIMPFYMHFSRLVFLSVEFEFEFEL